MGNIYILGIDRDCFILDILDRMEHDLKEYAKKRGITYESEFVMDHFNSFIEDIQYAAEDYVDEMFYQEEKDD